MAVKFQVFQVCIVHHKEKDSPDKCEDPKDLQKVISFLLSNPAKSQIVVEPKTILAKDFETAKIMAATLIPEDLKDKLEEIEVLVRPF